MMLLTQFAFWLYGLLLRLNPRYFREEFGAEVTAVLHLDLLLRAKLS